MKRCLVTFSFLILTLLIAVIIENTNKSIIEESVLASSEGISSEILQVDKEISAVNSQTKK